jgi:hypothetical protein
MSPRLARGATRSNQTFEDYRTMTDRQSIFSIFRAELARESGAIFSQDSAHCGCKRNIRPPEDESDEEGEAVIESPPDPSDAQATMREEDDVRLINHLASGRLETAVDGRSGQHFHDITAPPPPPQAGSPFACEGGSDPRDFKLSIHDFPWRCMGTYLGSSLGSGALVSHRVFLTCAHTLWNPMSASVVVPKYVFLGPLFISAGNSIPNKGYVRDIRQGLSAWVPDAYKSATTQMEKIKHDWGLVVLSDSTKYSGQINVRGGWRIPKSGQYIYGYGVPSPALGCDNAPDGDPWNGLCSGVIWGARGVIQDVHYRYIEVSGLHSQPGQSGMVGYQWVNNKRYICAVHFGCSDGKAVMKRLRATDVSRIIDVINANPSENFASPQMVSY